MKNNGIGARTEGLIRLMWKKAGRCPQNKQTAKLGRSLNARQGFLNTVTLEPCLSYKKSRWIVTLLLVRPNLLENGLSALAVDILGKTTDLLGIFILDDPSYSSTFIVNLFFLLTDSSHLPRVSSACTSALWKAARMLLGRRNLCPAPVCLAAFQGQLRQQEYEVCHQGRAVCINPSVYKENDTVWNVYVMCWQP